MILGRLLRFQGEFTESLAHLERSREKKQRSTESSVSMKTFVISLAILPTRCGELDDPASAERHLRAEITRRDRSFLCPPGQSLLELSLAEALFAQERFEEVEKLCLEIQTRPSLLKLEKLRLHITLAKIRHVKLDNKGALSYWSAAKKAIGKFHLTNGRSTWIIVLCTIY